MENKTSKYFKYAIGEIVLVVIGILIALQINNWNEANSEQNKLNNYLTTLKEELKGNLKRLDRAADRSKKDLKETVDIIREFNSDSAIHLTSEDIHSREKYTGPIFKVELYSAVYKDLINSGVLKNLENKTLKTKIFQIERTLENYDENFNNAKRIWDNYILPYYHKHKNVTGVWDSIDYMPMPKLKFKNDLKAFINNRDYANILASRARQIANLEGTARYMKSEFEELILDIDNYLKQHD